MSPRLIVATGNQHKLEELRRALPGMDIRALGRDDPPPEDGATFEDNARIKARFARAHADTDVWAVGEDSGIEAAALDGVTDRAARYVCVIVAVGPEGEEVVARGTLAGSIALSAAGDEGFGFDPVFVPEGESATVAVLGDAWKRTHSHRARAATALAELLA